MTSNSLRFYYLATPLFLILHFYFDLNLRVAMPGASTGLLLIYYLVCFAAGFVVFKNPVFGAIFSLAESSINIFLLILSVMLPVFTLGGAAGDQAPVRFGVAELLHFLLVGSILLHGFYLNPLILGKRLGRNK